VLALGMPFDYLVTVTLDPPSGFAEDAIVNTFTVVSPTEALSSDLANMANAVRDFYITTPASFTRPLSGYLAAHLQRDTAVNLVKVYGIADRSGASIANGGTPMGSPLHTLAFTMPAGGSLDSLPTQVSLVATLRGRFALTNPVEGPGEIRPRQRRSGRLFLGPFNLDAHDTTGVNQVSRPVLDLRNLILAAGEKLQDDLNANLLTWAVWSRSQETMYAVTSVEVDDSFDVLRSRQVAPTSRLKRVFAPVPDIALGA
jgi:hypothetical protein